MGRLRWSGSHDLLQMLEACKRDYNESAQIRVSACIGFFPAHQPELHISSSSSCAMARVCSRTESVRMLLAWDCEPSRSLRSNWYESNTEKAHCNGCLTCRGSSTNRYSRPSVSLQNRQVDQRRRHKGTLTCAITVSQHDPAAAKTLAAVHPAKLCQRM